MKHAKRGKHRRQLRRKETLAEEVWLMPRKKRDGLRAVICCPSRYELAMSSLGMWSLFGLLNDHPAFVPGRLVSNWPLRSLDGGHRAASATLFAFTINWELGFPEMVRILLENGIPLKPRERRESDPIVVAGGMAVTMNPAPLLPFCDLVALGDGEMVMASLMERLRESYGMGRDEMVRSLEGVPGTMTADSSSERVVPNRTDELDLFRTGPFAVTSRAQLGKTFLMEISRGCDRGCYFCGVSHWKGRSRHRSLDALKASLPRDLPEDVAVGLIGASAGDHPELKHILDWVCSLKRKLCIPSLRPDQVDDEVATLLARNDVRSISLGVEAGSEVLRTKVGKKMTDECVLSTCKRLTQAGIRNIKVYLLYGLPGETSEDLQRAEELLGEIREIQYSIRGVKAGKLTVSANPFVPKKGTPFRDERMPSFDELMERRKRLRMAARKLGVGFAGESPRLAKTQAAFSRGGEELADVFTQMARGVPSARAFRNVGLSGQYEQILN